VPRASIVWLARAVNVVRPAARRLHIDGTRSAMGRRLGRHVGNLPVRYKTDKSLALPDGHCQFYTRPIVIESGEGFAEAVGIVRGFPNLPGSGEQFSSEVGERGGFTTDPDDESQRRLMKQVELFPRHIAEN